ARATDTLTVLGPISETVASGVSKVGPGTLVLASANTYSGTTYVNTGVVRIQDANALGIAPNQVQRINLTGSPTGTLTLSFNGQTTPPIAVTPSAPIAASPTGATEAGNVVTITTSQPHGFTVGQSVVISGVAVAGYNSAPG